MYVSSIGSATDGSWVTTVPAIRNAKDRPVRTINPFAPDDSLPNPLKDIVTLSLHSTMDSGEISKPAYFYTSLYFMYPNQSIHEFARDVIGIRGGESNDVKMGKIAKWVQSHIRYMEDDENYGVEEFWAPPVFTLAKGIGDCEDGAFLIVSLALNSGVPNSRLRMYGGEVKVGQGAATGGHGWVGYLRESDNEWIPVDYSYYPNPNISTIKPLSEDERYIDDYFYITLLEFVETPGTNRVRDPEGYNTMGRLKNDIWIGSIIDNFV